MLEAWWILLPDRLRHELEELKRLGVEAEFLESPSHKGRAELRFCVPVNGERIPLIVQFPDLYPYFRFEVIAPNLALPYHQNPLSKNLCLIPSPTENWHTSDTVAAFVQNQLPKVLQTARSTNLEEAAAIELNQAEPISVFYAYHKDSVVLFDGSWTIDPSVSQGELLINLDQRLVPVLRATLSQVRDSRGSVLAQLDSSLTQRFQTLVLGRWVRVSEPVIHEDPAKFLDALSPQHRGISTPRWQRIGNSQIDITGVLFPEQVSYRTLGDGWIFLVRFRVERKGFRPHSKAYFARPARASRNDLMVRVPELKPLSTKRVAVLGLGCVGGPSVVEFAKAGVAALHIMDGDIVDPGLTVRWPLGLSAAGCSKAEILANYLRSEYPYTQTLPFHHKLGDSLRNQDSDLEFLDKFLSEVDLVYDATAEIGVQQCISDIARQRGIPYICISTTPGGWGGRIARIIPGRTQGCWFCLQNAILDDTIPAPPFDSRPLVQPAGCSSPTFTGASFDLSEVSLAGVRLAASTLCSSESTGYPDVDWDVGVLAIRDPDGVIIGPKWQTYKLNRHPACKVCKGQ